MNMKKKWTTLVAGAAAALVASGAMADSVLQMDFANLRAESSGTFSTMFSGTFAVDWDSNSTMGTNIADQGFFIDTVFQSIGANGFVLSDIDVDLTLSNGNITAGTLSIEVHNAVLNQTDTFTATLFDDNGAVSNIVDGALGFDISMGLGAGEFDKNTFGGVDVTAFANAEPLFGSFVKFNFDPGTGTVDDNAGASAVIIIPAPIAGAWGLAGLCGIAFLPARRRRA